jgi:hypothetical protein
MNGDYAKSRAFFARSVNLDGAFTESTNRFDALKEIGTCIIKGLVSFYARRNGRRRKNRCRKRIGLVIPARFTGGLQNRKTVSAFRA